MTDKERKRLEAVADAVAHAPRRSDPQSQAIAITEAIVEAWEAGRESNEAEVVALAGVAELAKLALVDPSAETRARLHAALVLAGVVP